MEVSKIAKVYKIGPTKWTQYFNRDGKVSCFDCGDSIEIEDLVVSRISRRRTGRNEHRLYCLKCGDELNIITEEQATTPLLEVVVSL